MCEGTWLLEQPPEGAHVSWLHVVRLAIAHFTKKLVGRQWATQVSTVRECIVTFRPYCMYNACIMVFPLSSFVSHFSLLIVQGVDSW